MSTCEVNRFIKDPAVYYNLTALRGASHNPILNIISLHSAVIQYGCANNANLNGNNEMNIDILSMGLLTAEANSVPIFPAGRGISHQRRLRV